MGEHEFTYSLYPHEGDWRSAGIVRKVAELNHELPYVRASSNKGPRVAVHSFIPFESDHVILDTVKPAEDGPGYILRMYESAGGRDEAVLSWPYPYESVHVSNALEEEIELLDTAEGRLALQFLPYEIKTIKLTTHHT